MKRILLILLILVPTTLFSKNFGLIISGGVDKKSNYSVYKDSSSTIKEFLLTHKVNETDIFSLIADSDSPATKKNLDQVVNRIKSKLSQNDHLFIFITDHGIKNRGIALWGNEVLSISELENYLNMLSENATKHILTDICYGGQLKAIKTPNSCFLSNSDSNTETITNQNSSLFIKKFTNTVNKGGTLSERFFYATNQDLSYNKTHTNSLIEFLKKNSDLDLDCNGKCDLDNFEKSFINNNKALNELNLIISNLSNSFSNDKKEKILKNLKNRVNYILNENNANYIKWLKTSINSSEENIKKTKKIFDDLPKQQQENERSNYTQKIESMRLVLTDKKATLERQQKTYNELILEINFLKKSSKQNQEIYFKIKECLDYEL